MLFGRLIILFFIFYILGKASDFTIAELEILKKNGSISEENYEFLKMELELGEIKQDSIYLLKINGKKVTNQYKVIVENNIEYFQLEDFFTLIGFTNYYSKKNGLQLFLGDSLDEYFLDYNKDKAFYKNIEIKTQKSFKNILVKNGKHYLEKNLFKKIFLSDLDIDFQKFQISMYLSFTPPIAIEQMIELTKYQLDNKIDEKELVFSGKRSLFDLGYIDFSAKQNFSRSKNESGFQKNWNSNISYQGGLLYGQFQFDYDLKEKKMSNIRLEYNQIWNNHTLEINKSNFDYDGTWSFKFFKDKGFEYVGGKVTIVETVPIGTRAELLYMGVPIAIEDEKNGKIIFTNDVITTNREYTLKLYYPNGRIEIKNIKTTNDYNRQRRNEIEYDINLEENKDEHTYTTSTNFFYGITDNFTFGAGYNRDLSKKQRYLITANKEDYFTKAYINSFNTDLVYGNTYNGYSYTLKLKNEFTLDSYIDNNGKSVKNKNNIGYLGEVSKDKWKVTYSQDLYDTYYDEKKNSNLNLYYDLFESLRLTYDYNNSIFYDGKKKDSKQLGVTYDKTLGPILFSSSAKFDLDSNNENDYNFSVYRTFENSLTARLENNFTNNGKDYEVSLNLYNNNYRGFLDFSTILKYSNKDKESFGFSFSMKIDDWFTADSEFDKDGNSNIAIGINKILDLKDPLRRVDSKDVSRAIITTFIDINNNNIYDKNEPIVPDVDIQIGQRKLTTDRNGRAKISNLSNGVTHNLDVTIKKPSYVVNNKFQILSNFNSEVEVNIPIKPMMNLSGYVLLDKSLGLEEYEIEDFYSQIVIQIIDKTGKEIDIAIPDNTGYFDISGLFPEDYLVKVFYTGNKFKILNLNEKLKLTFDEKKGFDFAVDLQVSDKKIVLNQK